MATQPSQAKLSPVPKREDSLLQIKEKKKTLTSSPFQNAHLPTLIFVNIAIDNLYFTKFSQSIGSGITLQP